jgi:hypothetical protein
VRVGLLVVSFGRDVLKAAVAEGVGPFIQVKVREILGCGSEGGEPVVKDHMILWSDRPRVKV